MLIIACIFSALTMIAFHYLPWIALFSRPLPSLVGYILGTVSIWLTFAAYHLLGGRGDPVLILAAIIAAAGATTLGCYALDAWLDSMTVREDLVDALTALQGLKDESVA